MELKVKKLHEDAILPTYGSPGAACFDLYALEDGYVPSEPPPGHSGHPPYAIVRTGLAVEIPSGWCMKVYSRSGHGFKNGIRLGNGTGIVDHDYRGEVMVILRNDSRYSFSFNRGDRIAQAMLVPVERVSFVEVEELSDTARGTGGFGSTGK